MPNINARLNVLESKARRKQAARDAKNKQQYIELWGDETPKQLEKLAEEYPDKPFLLIGSKDWYQTTSEEMAIDNDTGLAFNNADTLAMLDALQAQCEKSLQRHHQSHGTAKGD